jgi:hypothetical protein
MQPKSVASLVLSAVVGIGLLPQPAKAQSNPIVVENQQTGTSSWQIPWGAQGSDATGQIKGYGSAPSVNKGDQITFNVSVNPAQNYTIDVYRLGWYQGLGGRLMQHIGPLAGTHQATCPTDATTGLIECHWAPSYTLQTLTSWTSGVYVALLTNAQSFQNYIVFTVRDDNRVAPLLYQQQVTTYEAYNDYPYDNTTGKSLYQFNSYGANTISGAANAVKVSFDRPYNFDGSGTAWGQSFLSWEYPFIRWLEKSGYDVTYATNLETHLNGAMLLRYNGIISGAHDEYYSKQMYDAFIAARDAGVNLAFFGADAIGWQIRFEASSSGVPNRIIVCYRDVNLDPITDPTLKTVEWTDPALNRPEQTLKGVQYTSTVPWHSNTNAWANYVVTNSSSWVYAGTGFKDGDSVPGIVGYEADRYYTNLAGPTNAAPGTFVLLSQSTLGNGGANDYGNSAVYQANSGAWVFTTGTTAWSLGLDNYSGNNLVDARIQQTTANVLNRFVNPAVNFSIAALPTSQIVVQGSSTSYGVTVTPAGGFSGQVTMSISGLPAGATGTFSPNPATASSTLSVTTAASTPAGNYSLTITGTSGALVHSITVALAVTQPPDFSISASPSTQNVLAGGSTNYGVTINPTNGFGGQVSLSVAGLPTGATGSFSVNPATSSSTLTVTTGASTPLGTYSLTITGTSGSLTHTTTVSIVVSTPDFTLTPSPTSRTVTQGSPTTYGVTINPINGFSGPVSLSVSGLPVAAVGSFSPNPATTLSTLSVTTDVTSPAGTYTLTVTGTSGSLTHTTTVTLVVVAPDFSISATPASQTVKQGASTSYTATISPINGFSGQVSLSVSGLPTGATGTFGTNPATTTSALSITTLSTTPAGTYTLTITGTSGSLTHTTTVSLTVNRPGVLYDNAATSGFLWGATSATTPAFTIGTAANRAAMIMVAMTANNATGITASLGGIPATLVPGSDTGTTASIRTLIFQVINPPSGSKTATVSWVTAMNAVVSVITVSGADQTTPVINGTFTAVASAPSSTTSLTINSNAGDLTASVAFTTAGWVTPYTNQTLTWGPVSSAAAGDRGAGNGTTTHTWTDQWAFQTHSVSGANFKAF